MIVRNLPVRDLDTGKAYRSVKEACRALGLSSGLNTYIAITADRPIRGHRLAFVEPDDPDYERLSRRMGRMGRVVRNITTGQTYVSVREAAAELGIPAPTIYGAIQHGWAAHGHHWQYEFVSDGA